MAQFLRGKQAGIQKDFSAGLDPQLFAVDLVRVISPLQTEEPVHAYAKLTSISGRSLWYQLPDQRTCV